MLHLITFFDDPMSDSDTTRTFIILQSSRIG
jgi:hypothetical protein